MTWRRIDDRVIGRLLWTIHLWIYRYRRISTCSCKQIKCGPRNNLLLRNRRTKKSSSLESELKKTKRKTNEMMMQAAACLRAQSELSNSTRYSTNRVAFRSLSHIHTASRCSTLYARKTDAYNSTQQSIHSSPYYITKLRNARMT